MTDLPATCDVAIVGAGPAGLAAAVELRRRGVASVVVLDREPVAGGIPRHCDHPPFGLREFHRILRGPAYARRLVDAAVAAGVDIRTGVTVAALHDGPRLSISTAAGGLGEIAPRRVLLATGVRETSRAARLIGGTKPGGVMATGALQGLVHLEGLRPFARPVVVGTELVAFSALLTCRHAGIRPVAMIEASDRPTARWPAAWLPRLLGIPLMTSSRLVAVDGDRWVTAAHVETAGGGSRRIEADGVIVTGGFVPEASLLAGSHLQRDERTGGPVVDEFGRCTDPTVFAAGNLLRPVETAGWSWAEGRRAGAAIADSLAGRLPDPAGAVVVTVSGDALKYVVPQRWVGSGDPVSRHGVLQLRVTRRVRGRLSVRCDDRELVSRRLSSLPERRITVPLSVLPADPDGPVTIQISDERT